MGPSPELQALYPPRSLDETSYVSAVLMPLERPAAVACRAAIKMKASVNQDETVPMLG